MEIGASRMMQRCGRSSDRESPRTDSFAAVAEERRCQRVADVAAAARAAHGAVFIPEAAALHLGFGIEAASFDQAGRQAQRQGCVVDPLSGPEVAWAAAGHVRQWCNGPRLARLHSGTQGVANGQAKQATTESIVLIQLSLR